MGKERVELVRMLQAHHVIVRGGPDEGQRLLDALLVRIGCDLVSIFAYVGRGFIYLSIH